MLVLQTPDDVTREWEIIRKVARASMPDYVNLEEASWEWNLFCSIQLNHVQVWKVVDNVSEDFKLYGYLLTRVLIDDIFRETFLVIYGLKLFARPSAEILLNVKTHLEEWSKGQGISRIEAITNSPVTSKMALVFGFQESRQFTKKL